MRNFKKYLQEADAGSDDKTGEVEKDPKKEQLKKALEALKDYPPEVRAELEKQIRQAIEQAPTNELPLNQRVAEIPSGTMAPQVNMGAGAGSIDAPLDSTQADIALGLQGSSIPDREALIGAKGREEFEKELQRVATPELKAFGPQSAGLGSFYDTLIGLYGARQAIKSLSPASTAKELMDPLGWFKFRAPEGTQTTLPVQSTSQPRVGQVLSGEMTPGQIKAAGREIISRTIDPQQPPTDTRIKPEQSKPRATPTTPSTSGVGTRHTTSRGPDLGPPSGGGAGGGGGSATRTPTRPLGVVSTQSKSTVPSFKKFAWQLGWELLGPMGMAAGIPTSIQQKAPEPGDVITAPPAPPEVKPEEIPSIPGILPPEVEPDERKKPQPIAPPAPVTPPSKPSAPPEERPVPKPTPPATEPGEKPDVKPVPGPTKPATEPGEQPSTPPVPAPKPEPPAVPKPEKPAPTDKPSTGTAAGTSEKPKETPNDQGTPKKEPQPPFTPDPVKPTPPTPPPPTAPPPAPAAPPSPKKPPVVVPTSPQGVTGENLSGIDGGGRGQMFVSGLAGSADPKSGGIVTRFTYEVFEPETLISSARFSLINEAMCNSPIVRMIKIKKIVEEMKEKEMPEVVEDECPSDLGSESSQMFVSTQPQTTSGRSEEIKFKK